MVKDRMPEDASEEAAQPHRVPGLPADLKRVYDGMVEAGATGPSSGKPVDVLAKQLHIPKKEMLHDLHILEGKGVARHQTSGHDTSWYIR